MKARFSSAGWLEALLFVDDYFVPANEKTGPAVYFIEHRPSKLIKIGYSADVRGRFWALNGARDRRDCRLLTWCRGQKSTRGDVVREPKVLEKYLHAYFGRHREHGEWFRPAKPLKHFVEHYRTRFLNDLEMPHGLTYAWPEESPLVLAERQAQLPLFAEVG